jgi:hypothetical protein
MQSAASHTLTVGFVLILSYHLCVGLPGDLFLQNFFVKLQSPTKKNFLVPWFLGLLLVLFGALIQKNALDRPLWFLRCGLIYKIL